MIDEGLNSCHSTQSHSGNGSAATWTRRNVFRLLGIKWSARVQQPILAEFMRACEVAQELLASAAGTSWLSTCMDIPLP